MPPLNSSHTKTSCGKNSSRSIWSQKYSSQLSPGRCTVCLEVWIEACRWTVLAPKRCQAAIFLFLSVFFFFFFYFLINLLLWMLPSWLDTCMYTYTPWFTLCRSASTSCRDLCLIISPKRTHRVHCVHNYFCPTFQYFALFRKHFSGSHSLVVIIGH